MNTSIILKFRILSDENDNFVRDYEVDSRMNLVDFHNYICTNLKFDPLQITSFFTSNQQWDKLIEYTLLDMKEEGSKQKQSSSMEKITIEQIIRNDHHRLIYQFDVINERALYLEMIESSVGEPKSIYPRCTLMQESAPDQFDISDFNGSHSIFDDAMDDFNDFEGDDSYDED